jgi:hypothetical protein
MRAYTSRFRPSFDRLDGRLLLTGGGTTSPVVVAAAVSSTDTDGTMPGDDVDPVGSMDSGSSTATDGDSSTTTPSPSSS